MRLPTKIVFITLVLISAFILSSAGHADPIKAKHMQGILKGREPLSLEWSYMKSNREACRLPSKSVFRFLEPDKLEEEKALVEKELHEVYGLTGVVKKIGSVHVLMPKEKHSSNLDTIVTVKLKNVSTWQALKYLNRAINCNPVFGTKQDLRVIFSGDLVFPDSFWKDKTTTLHMANVPAREVLCEIFKQASHKMRYVYSNLTVAESNFMKSLLYVELYIDGYLFGRFDEKHRYLPELTDEKARVIAPEISEADEPLEDCLDTKEESDSTVEPE